MPEPQHTDPVAQFTRQLNHLVAALDPGEGWYAFLLQQDERAVRAYLDGTSVPPWDVVSSLLDDSDHKRGVIEGARDRARDLHRAAVGAHDRRIGRPALLGRLDTARDERDEAAAQLRRLYEPRPGGSSRPQPTADLFPARDRHERASARFLELEARLAFLDAALAAEPGASAPHPPPAATRRTARAASAALAAIAFGAPQVQEPEARAVLPQPVADPAVAAAAVGAARSATVRLADLRAKGLGGRPTSRCARPSPVRTAIRSPCSGSWRRPARPRRSPHCCGRRRPFHRPVSPHSPAHSAMRTGKRTPGLSSATPPPAPPPT